MRVWQRSLVLTGLALACLAGRAEQAGALDALQVDQQHLENRRKAQERLAQERLRMYEDVLAVRERLKQETERALEPLSGEITVDEQTIQVRQALTMEEALRLEPGRRVRDEYEVSPDDFDVYIHERWSLHQNDFRFDPPQYFSTRAQAGGRKWFGFSFQIKNSSSKARRIAPFFTAVTNKGVFNQAVGGLVPERILANSLGRPLVDSTDRADQELLAQNRAPLETPVHLASFVFNRETQSSELAGQATFQPGQTRWGAALWTNFSEEFTELKIMVSGLTNSHRHEQKLRRVLVLTFARNDDEFHTHRTPLVFKGQQWEYLWMWDQDLTVPIPDDPRDPQIKSQPLPRPTGESKLVWTVPFVLKNSSPSRQELTIRAINFICPLEVEVAGHTIPVEAHVTDDGYSTIYKAEMMRLQGREFVKDRFGPRPAVTSGQPEAERRKLVLESGDTRNWLFGIFDEADVDWNDLKLQVETALTAKLDKPALARENWERLLSKVAPGQQNLVDKDPGVLYDPRRLLTEDEMSDIRAQVARALPGAVEKAKSDKTVLASFDCISGLSSGVYRIKRSYRQPGIIQDDWLKAWEALEE